MARTVKPLTVKDVENAKPKEKEYTLTDGGGLALLIKPKGGKYWIFNYYQPHTKKRKLIGLGTFPTVTLAQARAKREEYKGLISQDIDPLQHRQKEGLEKAREIENTFQVIANSWIEFRRTKERFSESYEKSITAILKNYLLPSFGHLPLSSITALQAIKFFEPLQSSGKLRTLHDAIKILNLITNYAVNRGLVAFNPFHKLAVEFDKPKGGHFATIKPEELRTLLKKFKRSDLQPRVKMAFLWQLLTLARPAEAVKAQFNEIDETAKIWGYYVLKGQQESTQGRLHKVTLSTQAIKLLKLCRTFNKTPYLFPSSQSKRDYITPVTVVNALYKLGYKDKCTAHGFRSIASTYLNERGHNKDLIEVALSHIDKDRVRKAYNRAEYLEQRAEMLQEWGDFVEKASGGDILDLF